jgi:hypothetical protein
MPRSRWQFSVTHLLILIAVIATGIGYHQHLEPIDHWTAHYDLKVQLVGAAEVAVTRVDAYPLADDRELTWFRANPTSFAASDPPVPVTLAPDRSFSLDIKTEGRRSRSGRQVRYHQPKYLGVVLALEDGTTRRLWVELPDGRKSKEVVVNITP